ncbi:hypothetical protein TWF718_005695 [Orbilia javanica]|uniref:Uncharacterized protein n=1 Tax=Orbilia javanica TaxID=47235 RepID=A0AAN8RDQ7_9PEZI
MNSTRRFKQRDWYKIVEREFLRRGAPKDEQTTKKAKCLVGRVRKERPSLGGLIAIIRKEEEKKKKKKKDKGERGRKPRSKSEKSASTPTDLEK